MADQDLSLTFSVDSSAATDGIAQVNTALEQTATDAQAAGTAAAAAGQAVVDGTAAAAPAVSAVDQATQQLTATLANLSAAMSNPNSGPRVLMRDSAQAQLALMAFKQAAADAGVSTDQLGVSVSDASAKILDASTRASAFTIELGKVRAAGMEAANQLQALQGHGTSLTGMFQEMIKTGGAATQAIGQLGVSLGIGMVAFAGAEAAGRKLGAAIDYVANKELALMDIEIKGANQKLLMIAAQKALDAGLIANSDSVAGLIKNYNDYTLASGRGSDASKKAALGFNDAQMAAMSYADVTAKAETTAAALTGQFTRQGAANDDLAKKTTALTTIQQQNIAAEATGLQTAAQKHDADWRESAALDAVTASQKVAITERFASIEMMKQEEPALRKIEQAYRDIGEAVPVGVRAALDALDNLKKKNSEVTTSMQDLMKVWNQLPQVMLDAIAKEKEYAASVQDVANSHERLVPAIQNILKTLAAETTAAGTGSGSFQRLQDAQDKAAVSLAAYAVQTGHTIQQVMDMVANQGGLAKALNDTNSEYAKSLVSKYGADMALASERTKDEIQNQKDLAAATAAANAEFDKQAAAVKARNAAIDQSTQTQQNFSEAQTNGIAVEGQAKAVYMQVTAATQAQTDALVALLKQQNAYNASVANTLTVAKGWNDYLATLADSYKAGSIDLIQYKQSLEDFQTQLEQTFAGATGKAKDAITSMTQAIQVLINTAGAGNAGTGDTSITGQLNNAFNKP
jgi:hypothetical protein